MSFLFLNQLAGDEFDIERVFAFFPPPTPHPPTHTHQTPKKLISPPLNLLSFSLALTGETQAEYFAEGLLRRLLDDADATGRAARAAATFFVVPNMNPDGSWRGHLRTNAAGVNLNRAWKTPVDREQAPEVALVLEFMDEAGVDFLCDVHGDETLPAVFAAGCEGVPSFDDARAEMQARFYKTLAMMCPEFQTAVGYPRTARGKANLSLAKNAIAERFNCLAMTLVSLKRESEKRKERQKKLA